MTHQNSKTIFEKIVDREIPAAVIYEDARLLAFLDIAPMAFGHTLLITKTCYPWIQDVPDQLLADAFVKAKQLVKDIKKGTDCDFVQLGVVGKDVPHFHIHLIPRWYDDNLETATSTEYADTLHMQKWVDKIKAKK